MSISTTTSPTLEFEAPSTATSDFHQIPPLSASKHKQRFSIDLSLELERQLEMETSEPPTPAHDSNAKDSLPQRESLDPHVLAHIIMQLRHSLADMTKERDELLNLLSTAHSQEAHLRDALQLVTDKATNLEEELSETRKKLKADEESISMLRKTVEESRRGLMRLQTESRRQSVQPIDLSRASSLINFGSSPSAKRQSFTPLTGSSFSARPNAHKRISSVSDSLLDFNTSPNSQTITLPSETPVSQRFSGLFGRNSPPQDESSLEVVSLRKEVEALKSELDDTRRDLSEAVEAKDASDTCVKALREFIEENNVGQGGGGGVNLPPLPSTTNGAEEASATSKPAGGWGFKLWKVDTSVKPTGGPTSPSSVTPTGPSSASVATPTATAPLSRKITGFFGMQPATTAAAADTNAGSPLSQNASRASVYSASDASSVAEPLSPLSEGSVNVIVRDGANGSDIGHGQEHQK